MCAVPEKVNITIQMVEKVNVDLFRYSAHVKQLSLTDFLPLIYSVSKSVQEVHKGQDS